MATSAEYSLGEFVFPRGWFMVGASEEASTAPLAVRFFGQDMVLYRGQSGRAFLVEAYCPHMGTHLARNTSSYVVKDGEHVEGDSIRCPYHGWRFGPDGKCDDIPYSPAPIPKAACLKSWQLIERAGCIWMWHDSEGGAPDYDVPAFENYENPAWVKWKIDQLGELACHPQEIVDNMTDKGHLGPVHGSVDMVLFVNEFSDHVVRQILSAGHKTLSTSTEPMTNDTWYTGPGILQSTMEGEMPSLILITHTPVDDGVVKVWHALLVRSQHDVATEDDVIIARAYQQSSLEAFSQDFEIWAHKRACINPMMVKGDGPFDKLRVWYKQFYNSRARAGEFQARVNGRYETRGTSNAPWDAAA